MSSEVFNGKKLLAARSWLLATDMYSKPHVSTTAQVWKFSPRPLAMTKSSSRARRGYFSFGGRVRPNTEILPFPATLTFASFGLGKYNVLQCSQRYTSAFLPHAFSASPQPCSITSVV